ncbi:6,7-dimethyl-8-ribityllumazine synthase [Planctomicrobium sp. SH661]|uniref:6,7-dimethyl-8-ribityllumazine synthase n=1 Tax=Planctomicrobium sp. SH661 TaxID=3448124 RepID=UPI003F5B815C
MATQIIGKLDTQPHHRYGIVVSRYHEEVTRRLLEGAVGTLERHGLDSESITIAWVPGSFEIPVVADAMANSGKFVAVIALGAVVQGDTDHHDYINHAVAQGLAVSSRKSGVPVLFGVLTCRNMEQAMARAGGAVGNKGAEAALAAIETVSVLEQLRP